MPKSTFVVLDGRALHAEDVERVAVGAAAARLAPNGRRQLEEGRQRLLSALADGEPHYGVNTGFGSLSRQRIPDRELAQLQRNLIRSHAAGAGAPLPVPVVRATMLLLAASLTRGLSGVRPVVVDQLLRLLAKELTPVVPETGSVGASGDLAPLAHIALVLIGEGEVWSGQRRVPAGRALRRAGVAPIELAAKEGLALINGTHLMAAQLALLQAGWSRVLPAALVAFAMSLDACRASDAYLDPRVYVARNQPGAQAVAAELRRIVRGSRIVRSHLKNDPRVQDPYSFRCAPIVLGAVVDAAAGAWRALGQEMGAVTDNPLVFAPSRRKGRPDIVSAGNFHGMPLALPLDVLAIACSHLAGIAERRVYHMISAFDPESHLRPFLTARPGLNSGLMIAQYTAAAACNELIGLAAPASVANLSTCAGMEDYNSFGPRAAAKAVRALQLVTTVVAIELLCAAQGLEYHRPLRSSRVVEQAHALIRRRVKKLGADRPLAPDIAALESMVITGDFVPLVKFRG